MTATCSWATLSWPAIEAALQPIPGQHAVGLVPVGAIEQHGPHLPTGTDTIVATALCNRAAELTGALALPAISPGVSYGHGAVLPGTLSLSPALFIGLVQQYSRWASVSGLERLLFVNAHFGNSAALSVATDEIRLQAPQLRVGVLDWWALTPEISAEVLADGQDIHANRAETSMMLAVAPETVISDRIAEADDEDRSAGLVFRYTAPALSTNGVTGRPSEATVELGRSLFAQAGEAIAAAVVAGRTEESPLTPPAARGFPF